MFPQTHEGLDKQKRKLENMIHGLQDNVNDKENRVMELQNSLDKTMEDVARLTIKCVIILVICYSEVHYRIFLYTRNYCTLNPKGNTKSDHNSHARLLPYYMTVPATNNTSSYLHC